MNLDNAEVFAALAVAAFAVLWRAASLRGDIRRDWSPRVEDAEVGLADRATRELLALQGEIASLVGTGDAASLPRLATVDPAPLAARASDFQKTLAMASRISTDFRWLLRVGPLLVAAAAIFLIGLGILFVDNSELERSLPLRVCGFSCGISGFVFGLVLLSAWVVLNQRLSGAEMRSSEDVQ